MPLWLSILTLLAALGAGLVGGVFLAFSSFVMRSLGRLPAPQAVAAMQAINVDVIGSVFLNLFFATGLLCLALIVAALGGWAGPAAPWLTAGAALYLVGNIAVTIFANVPRNDALARVDTDDGAAAAEGWARYDRPWTRWNHVRTATAAAAAALFFVALMEG